jgi:hypothetical protein
VAALVIVSALVTGWIVRFPAPTTGVRAAPASPLGWRTYRAPDGAFTVTGPPGPEVRSVPTELGNELSVRFPAPPDQIFAVEAVDLAAGVAVGASEGQLVAAWANRLLGGIEGVLDEQDILRAGEHPGIALRVESGGRDILVRVFASGSHVYEVASAVPVTASDAAHRTADAFVGSFTLAVPVTAGSATPST